MRNTEIAVQHFEEGHACSQAVLAAFAEQYDIPLEITQRISAVFGGGVGHQGLTCGAVNGAFMVISLAYGRLDPEDEAAVEKTDELVARFSEHFRSRFGHLTCDALLGIDSSRPGARAAAKEQGIFAETCPGLVKGAVEILNEIL
ncbi:MAG: C_GCAxxG_C_C family protein [bacterium]|nr:C_GCAxxG_C_C family protein [bacterium]